MWGPLLALARPATVSAPTKPAPTRPAAMPRICSCGARRRRDLSCPTPTCQAFRLGRRGSNLLPRATRRLRGKQPLSAACSRPSKDRWDWSAQRRPAPELGTPAPAPSANVPGDVQQCVRQLLRAADLEAMLVDVFGEPGFYAIHAVAFRHPCCCGANIAATLTSPLPRIARPICTYTLASVVAPLAAGGCLSARPPWPALRLRLPRPAWSSPGPISRG
jgi:hypothetical protein